MPLSKGQNRFTGEDQVLTESRIKIEVAYALSDKQRIVSVDVVSGTTLLDAVKQSGIIGYFPEIDLDSAKMGIFGKVIPRPAEYAVKEGDRIEIYRPLIADPKEVRKRRAEQAKLKRQ